MLLTLHDCNMLLTSSLKFLSYEFLSVELESNVGCLKVGLPNLGPALVSSLIAFN